MAGLIRTLELLRLMHVVSAVLGAVFCPGSARGEQPEASISPERSLVWGAGLEPRAVLPVRYFYIQAVSTSGKNFTRSPGKESFQVRITALSPAEHVRIHVPQPLDRGDGSFLTRFRLYGSVAQGLKIEVLHRDRPVARSPYVLKGPVYHEYCDCPEADPRAWQSALSCPAQDPQISRDFSAFPSVDLLRLLKEVPQRFSQRGGLIHYTVLDNRVYRRTLGKYTDFKMFSDEMLLSLARKVRLPDVEFYINVGDWPMENRKVGDTPGPVPIISWCGSTDTRDIILPTYDITHSTLETMRGVSNDLLSVQGNTDCVRRLLWSFRALVGKQDGAGLLPGQGQPRGAPPAGAALSGTPAAAGRRHHGLLLLPGPGEGAGQGPARRLLRLLQVQVPGECGRDRGCLQVPLPHAGKQPGAEAGLALLRALLHTPGAREALRSSEEEPLRPHRQDQVGQGERR
ncbi:protein O-glucosyltransferase 3 isoform X2 [Lepisosteus oculatus]|uniref:protein O-glucosyltransferase 3 isoform X2 n=1 Tax=Lepisosteus oculatus TaxID=7918 RepID=UPI003710933F